jgi:hypothetical protein
MELKKIDIKEREELEPMLLENLSLLEEGMKVVAHQLATPTGPLDILAVDEDGALALLELKNEVDDREEPLLQGIRYYDWVTENRAWIANVYKNMRIDPQKEPRLILVAPDFSTPLKRLAKFLAVEVELFRYQAIQLPSGEKSLVVNQDFYDERPDTPRITSIPQSAERIQDQSAKQVYEGCIEDLKARGIELQPRAKDTVSGFHRGKRIIRIYVKNRFFAIRIQSAEGSMSRRIRISNTQDWEQFIQDHLAPRMTEIEG